MGPGCPTGYAMYSGVNAGKGAGGLRRGAGGRGGDGRVESGKGGGGAPE